MSDQVDLETLMRQMFADRDRAVQIAVVELKTHLDNLNHAFQRDADRSRDFYSRVEHAEFAKAVDGRFDRIAEAQRPNWGLLVAAIPVALSIIAGAWFLVIEPYRAKLDQIQTDVRLHMTQEAQRDRVSRPH